MSEEMPTPLADELAAKIPGIPWSGNETDAVRQAVYGALAAWSGFARELERNLHALQAATGISPEFANKVVRAVGTFAPTHDLPVEGEHKRTRSGLAQSANEAARYRPQIDDGKALAVEEDAQHHRTKSVPAKKSHKKRR